MPVLSAIPSRGATSGGDRWGLKDQGVPTRKKARWEGSTWYMLRSWAYEGFRRFGKTERVARRKVTRSLASARRLLPPNEREPSASPRSASRFSNSACRPRPSPWSPERPRSTSCWRDFKHTGADAAARDAGVQPVWQEYTFYRNSKGSGPTKFSYYRQGAPMANVIPTEECT